MIGGNFMLQFILDLPNQIKTAVRLAKKLNLPKEYRKAKNVIVLGMGGSAIGGDLAKAICPVKIPFEVIRDFTLPSYAGKNSLVFAISYSGNTQEVISAYKEAKEKKAKTVVITQGGRLEQLAKKDKTPLIKFSYKSQPRTAIGFLFAPITIIMKRLGLVQSPIADLENIKIVKNVEYSKKIAKKLKNKIPIICAGDFLLPLAKRLKNQFNENSKIPAASEEIPEIFHNVVEGISFPKNISKSIIFVFIGKEVLSSKEQKKLKLFEKYLQKKRIPYLNLKIEGKNKINQLLNGLILADLVSYFLAKMYKADFSETKVIEDLKSN